MMTDKEKEEDLTNDNEHRSFATWQVGQTINGRKLVAIYAKNKHLIIYKFKGDLEAASRIKKTLSDTERHISLKYSEYSNKVNELSVYHSRTSIFYCLNRLYGACMLAPELTNEIVDAKFRQIDIQIERAKRRINKVYSTNINFSIYLDDSLRIRTHYNISQTAANVDLAKCQYKAKQLESYAHEYLEGEQLELALDQIAICLSHSFKLNQMNERVEPSEVFQSVEDLLDSKFSAKLRLKFIGWVIGFTVLFAILLTLILFNTQNIELYVKSMLIALLGSFISIVQRHNLIKTTVNMSPITVAIESFSRICIGIIFGFICILLSKSGLALANFADNQHALLVFSFLSGFSERFIPNMLDTVANNQQATRK